MEVFRDKSTFDSLIATPVTENRLGSLERLKKLINATCLRRTKMSTSMSSTLPEITKRVESVELHKDDQLIYDFFKEKTSSLAAGISEISGESTKRKPQSQLHVLYLMNILRLVCNHGKSLLPASALEILRENSANPVDWSSLGSLNPTCESCGDEIEETEPLTYGSPRAGNGVLSSFCSLCSPESNSDRELSQSKQKDTQVVENYRVQSNAVACPTIPSAKVERLLENLSSEKARHKEGSGSKRYVSVARFEFSN